MTDGDTESGPFDDRIILAFSPSDDDSALKGQRWSLYKRSLGNPYAVPDGDEKIMRAIEALDPIDYELRDWEHWIRLDWQSVVDGDPERIEFDPPDYYEPE